MDEVIALTVEKRDGTTEPFDRTKIEASVTSAGGTAEQAEQVADHVESWAQTVEAGSVKALDIWNMVIEQMRMLNPAAAETFESYRLSK
ncbi:MAG: ATP cone domain-containing protein [Candidatus Dojkabacteria bacterium]|nr:ATP cone domain-containing protein [Candidatus Dojkabacteria bacterium]